MMLALALLTLAQAEEIAVKNNPRIAVANYTAEAAAQVPAEYRSAYYPMASASLTGAA